MIHPKRDDWIPFLYGESSTQDRQRLGQHLADCPECAREIGAWRRSLRRLNAWSLPKSRTFDSGSSLILGAKWALAAGVVLGIGIIIGRLGAPAEVRLSELRAQVEASVRSSLREEMNDALDELQTQTSNSIRSVEARLASASAAETQRLWRSTMNVLNSARADDAGRLQASLERFQQRHDSHFIALRKDLETLASATDEEIRQARLNLIQLASGSTPADN